jgi:hypothetical protein
MTPPQRPHCAACWGDGFVNSIFSGEREYCDACEGTGYDLYYLPGSTRNDQQQQPRRMAAGNDTDRD